MPRVSSHFGLAEPRLQSLTFPMVTNVTGLADANVTYTPAQLMGGLITRSISAARTDTLPSAAAMVEAVQGAQAVMGLNIPGLVSGHSFEFFIRNISGGAFTLTIALGAGGVADGPSTMTIAQANTRGFKFVFTNVAIGSEAYTIIGIGAATH